MQKCNKNIDRLARKNIVDLLLNRTATMKQDIIITRALNDRTFYRNNLISKRELETRVEPYLQKYNMTFSSFLTEETVRRIASRKNKRRIEKAQIIGMVFIMILGLYAVGETEAEVRDAQILVYNYR